MSEWIKIAYIISPYMYIYLGKGRGSGGYSRLKNPGSYHYGCHSPPSRNLGTVVVQWLSACFGEQTVLGSNPILATTSKSRYDWNHVWKVT